MAEVAEFRLHEEDLSEEEEIETLVDSSPFSSQYGLDHEVMFSVDTDLDSDPFSPRLYEFLPIDRSLNAEIDVGREDGIEEPSCVEIVDSSDADSVANLNDKDLERQVRLVFDLVEGSSERTNFVENGDSLRNAFSDDPFFGVMDENREMSSNYDELGLGLGFDRVSDGDEDDVGVLIEECANELLVGRRAESAVSSGIRRAVESIQDGLRVVGIESVSDEAEEGVAEVESLFGEDDELYNPPDDLDLPLCWDCLRLEDQMETSEDFEWEEVDERMDDGEVLNMAIDGDDERSVSLQSEEVGEAAEEALTDLEWQILLQINNLERNPETEHDFDHDGYIYPAEYEMLFDQFTENEVSVRGNPPAAESFVKNLPSIVLIQEDAHNEDSLCAVCKDEILAEEQAKLLPCTHYYHGECILPWLNIRNTCPVCRFELPTDDPEYERRR